MSKLKRIKWKEGTASAQNARRELPVLVSDYFTEIRQAVAAKSKPSDLHGLRLLTKRLRYTLELFRPCYGPGLRARIAALRRLQQCLGEVNDCATAAAVLANFSAKNGPQRKTLDRFLRQRGVSKIAEFRREWSQVFDAPGQERWWTVYLAHHTRPARRSGRKS